MTKRAVIKSLALGGARIAIGLLLATLVIASCVWGYSEWEQREEDRLAKAIYWDEKVVAELGATMKLRTKFEGSNVFYIATIESKGRPAAEMVSVSLLDQGGFALAHDEILIGSFIQAGDEGTFQAEGSMDGYLRAKDYKRVTQSGPLH